MNDLQLIKFKGDDGGRGLKKYRDAIRNGILHFAKPPTPEQWKQIEELMLEELRKSQAMEMPIAAYDWAENSDPKKNIDWILERIQHWLNQKRKRDNRKDIEEALKQGRTP